MTIRENVYNMSPIFIQNLMVSMYGLKLYYERYLGNHKKYLRDLLISQWLSKDEILSYQTNKLRELINHAYTNVPYYTMLFREYGLYPSDFKSIEDIKKLPVLDKETVREKSDLLVAKNMNPKKLITSTTSGTTGKSLRIFVDIDSRRKEYAFITRSQMWAGLKNGMHNITLMGKAIVPQSQKKNVFWRYNAIMANYFFSSYHLSQKNLPYYIDKIKKIKPLFIDSYPSSVYTLAHFMDENSITGIYPKSIITTAETLLEYQRDIIEKVFECRIYDQYGCAEQAVFISQCEKGTYHIHPEYGFVEIINDNDDEVSPGETGKIICTSFMNKAMPLIRYDIGDIVMKGKSDSCDCGRNFPIVEMIYGRDDDFILTSDGRKISRLSPCFKGLKSIKMTQIVQNTLEEIEIFVVPGKSYNQDDGRILKNEIKKRVGDSMKISMKLVEAIPKSKSGKFKLIVSNLTT